MNVDLPNLTSINLQSSNFERIQVLILYSRIKKEYLLNLDLPNLQNVDLLGLFENVKSKTISSLV